MTARFLIGPKVPDDRKGLLALPARPPAWHAACMRFGSTQSHHRPGKTGSPRSTSCLSEPDPASAAPRDELFGDADEAAVGSLESAVAALNPYMQERIIPSRQIINPLLDVWSAAQSVDPSAARPLEELLTVLISRTTTTPAELVAALDEMRIAVLQIRVLIHS
jgi:hypothetical protein